MQMVRASHPRCLIMWEQRAACAKRLRKAPVRCALHIALESAARRLGSVAETLRALRDVNRVNEEWFSDMDAVRRKVGILEEQPVASTSGKVQ